MLQKSRNYESVESSSHATLSKMDRFQLQHEQKKKKKFIYHSLYDGLSFIRRNLVELISLRGEKQSRLF